MSHLIWREFDGLGRNTRVGLNFTEKGFGIRAALGAGRAAPRRTLLAESLLLCGAGALPGTAIAWPAVAITSGCGEWELRASAAKSACAMSLTYR